MSGMDGGVNTPLRDRITQDLHNFKTYEASRRLPEGEQVGGDMTTILVAEDAVRSRVGYLLMMLTRINERADSLVLDRFIKRQATEYGIGDLTGNSFLMMREDAK
jgi:hypothetical protein